jgi:hypothetical protein
LYAILKRKKGILKDDMKGTIVQTNHRKMFVIKIESNEPEFELLTNAHDHSSELGYILDSINGFVRENFDEASSKLRFNIFVTIDENKEYGLLYGCEDSEFTPSAKVVMEDIALHTAISKKFNWETINASDEEYEFEKAPSKARWYKLPYVGMVFDIPFISGEIYQGSDDYYIRSEDLSMCEFLDECPEPKNVYKVISAEDMPKRR